MTTERTASLVEHFFRHESGRLRASLVRLFGLRHFDLVEDMVQSALMEALRSWQHNGVPENPAAWVHRVARNRVLDALRREKTLAKVLQDLPQERNRVNLDNVFDDAEIQDSLLRMIFVCCHPDLPSESAIPLTLKSVCGFSEREIAQCLLIEAATVRKRIYRAKRSLVQRNVSLELPTANRLTDRLTRIHNVLYLMFNLGYASSAPDEAIRMDVCEEAARLCHLLTENTSCSNPTTHALLALMLFHASRFASRIDPEGALVLLEDQDRNLWDRRLISRALQALRLASRGTSLSSYHIEAAIAMHHCSAATYADTNWPAIIKLYERLIDSSPSPVYRLNHAIAVGQRDGARAAISLLHDLRSDPRLTGFHLLDAAFGEFYRLDGQTQQACSYFAAAIQKTPSKAEQELLHKRMKLCQNGGAGTV